jgi:hypothetical protein
MAQPNIVNVANIYGQSVGATLTTSYFAFITVTAEYVVKVNSIIVSNIDGSNAATCDIKLVKPDATPVGITNWTLTDTIQLAKTVNVPADDILVVIDTPFYMMEGDALSALASAAGDLDILISFEAITD